MVDTVHWLVNVYSTPTWHTEGGRMTSQDFLAPKISDVIWVPSIRTGSINQDVGKTWRETN